MNRLLSMVAIAVVLFGAAESRAQFFDDFDGDSLGPHWQTWWPDSEAWDYQVSGGLLTVNSLNLPSSFGSPTNYQYLDTFISPVFGDFTAIAVMGLTAGSHRSISMRLSGSQGGGLGEFNYLESGAVVIGPGPTTVLPMALDPGLHEFKMVRTGAQISYFIDNALLGTLANANVDQGAYWLRLRFEVDHPAGLPMAPIIVDRVSVVPAPAHALLVLSALVGCARRRRN